MPVCRTRFGGLVAVLTLLGGLHSAAYAEQVVFADAHGRRILVDTEDASTWLSQPGPPLRRTKGTGIAFSVRYLDVEEGTGVGFDDPVHGATRRAVVDQVLTYLDSVLDESGVCDVEFEESELDGGGFLASAGTFFAVGSSTFSSGYAHRHITTGNDPSGSVPDIFGTVDFGYSWNSTLDPPRQSQFDLYTTLLHELAHGLGLLSLSDSGGASEITGGTTGVFSFWDAHLQTGNGLDLWIEPGTFIGTPQYLRGTNNGVVFSGPEAVNAYVDFPPVYAPSPFEEGSSVSHVDPSIAGDAVMTPFVSPGEMVRTFHVAEVGMLRDIGYDNAGAAPPPPPLPAIDFELDSYVVGEDEGSVALTVELSQAPGVGMSVEVAYSTSDGTADVGDDYESAAGTVVFNSFDTRRAIVIAVLDDGEEESNETVEVTLSDAIGGILLGAKNPATVIIMDDDTPPELADSDGDGLSDNDENAGTSGYFTDPNDADSDGDGMPDGWEVGNGLNPTVDDAGIDADDDGISNLGEYLQRSDPQNPLSPSSCGQMAKGESALLAIGLFAATRRRRVTGTRRARRS
jgi:Calx-beta domain-containing protein